MANQTDPRADDQLRARRIRASAARTRLELEICMRRAERESQLLVNGAA